MRDKVGLWVDYRKAMVVTVPDEGEDMWLTLSGVETHLRRSGDASFNRHCESPPAPTDDRRRRTFAERLNLYYDTVIACIDDAESILIFGPGEAKGELKNRLEKSKAGRRIAGVETVDRMTHRQIATKVRQRFAEHFRQQQYRVGAA